MKNAFNSLAQGFYTGIYSDKPVAFASFKTNAAANILTVGKVGAGMSVEVKRACLKTIQKKGYQVVSVDPENEKEML